MDTQPGHAPQPTDPLDEPLRVITGPTAAGKSAIALPLAERLGCEILSMDSMAVYRRMDIGTAKPTLSERGRVRHHLIDLVEPDESYDTGRWCRDAEVVLEQVLDRGSKALFVGGTPLYLMAFFKGLMEGPAADAEVRAALEARERARPGSLHEELSQRDPAAAERIHRRDLKRLVRALEVLELTGMRISERQEHFERQGWRRPCRIVVVQRPRAELHARVRARTERMLEAGLLEETRAIRDGCGFSRTAAAAIGYAECLRYLDGGFKDREELRNRIRRATHRLIRRQLTWLRRLPEIRWVAAEAGQGAVLDALETR